MSIGKKREIPAILADDGTSHRQVKPPDYCCAHKERNHNRFAFLHHTGHNMNRQAKDD